MLKELKIRTLLLYITNKGMMVKNKVKKVIQCVRRGRIEKILGALFFAEELNSLLHICMYVF